MLKLRLTPQALVDMEEIFEYTLKTWGLKQAEKYQDEIDQSFLTVTQNPNIGLVYYFKKGNYRKIMINRHLIFYRANGLECTVVRILHERMDLQGKLG